MASSRTRRVGESGNDAMWRAGAPHHIRNVILMPIYCLAIFFVLDFLYSNSLYPRPSIPPPRIADAVFHHTLAPNYDGYEAWGGRVYRIVTDSLGFKDAAARHVSPTVSSRRVLLIGDSFTEGIGIPFAQTFAGMLAQAGLQRADKTEFLNAAVVSFSPTLYYRKIKFLLDSGLTFDEVVVLPDLSDVRDEATSYFCFDDDPQYAALCRPASSSDQVTHDEKSHLSSGLNFGQRLGQNFSVSDALRQIVKFRLSIWRGTARPEQLTPSLVSWPIQSQIIGWSIPNYDVGNAYAPLGVEGGIARALEHMRALAELLKRRNIPLTVGVYPWPLSLVQDDPAGRWVSIWQDFCSSNCKVFINAFPDFIAAKAAHADWYEKYFIVGDYHFSAAGHRLVFDALMRNGL